MGLHRRDRRDPARRRACLLPLPEEGRRGAVARPVPRRGARHGQANRRRNPGPRRRQRQPDRTRARHPRNRCGCRPGNVHFSTFDVDPVETALVGIPDGPFADHGCAREYPLRRPDVDHAVPPSSSMSSTVSGLVRGVVQRERGRGHGRRPRYRRGDRPCVQRGGGTRRVPRSRRGREPGRRAR